MTEQEKGLVSVIIPCYKGRRFIKEAVDSVLNQTYEAVEVIVVDDCSCDGSLDLLESLAEDARVQLLRHQRNRGIPSARNTGIRAARGEYIAFLDQDDIWFPEKLAKQLEILMKPGSEKLGLVFSDILVAHGEPWVGEKPPYEFVPPGVNSMSPLSTQRKLLLVDFIPTITAVIPRHVLSETGLLDESLTGGSDDHDLFLRIAGNYRIAHVDEALALRREHRDNFSDLSKMTRDQVQITEKMAGLFPHLADLRKKKLGNIHESLGYQYCQRGDYLRAIASYTTAIRENPGDPTLWFRFPGVVAGLVFGRRIQEAYFEVGRRVRGKISKVLCSQSVRGRGTRQ